ncbi:exported hypothetical protein [Magnetospirillum sp. SS-4]|nr:exported hypothetical protein [Magnetospirillum sp. SS-4]
MAAVTSSAGAGAASTTGAGTDTAASGAEAVTSTTGAGAASTAGAGTDTGASGVAAITSSAGAGTTSTAEAGADAATSGTATVEVTAAGTASIVAAGVTCGMPADGGCTVSAVAIVSACGAAGVRAESTMKGEETFPLEVGAVSGTSSPPKGGFTNPASKVAWEGWEKPSPMVPADKDGAVPKTPWLAPVTSSPSAIVGEIDTVSWSGSEVMSEGVPDLAAPASAWMDETTDASPPASTVGMALTSMLI